MPLLAQAAPFARPTQAPAAAQVPQVQQQPGQSAPHAWQAALVGQEELAGQAVRAAPPMSAVPAEALAALEEDLESQCAELERQLREDPLAFENEALEVTLVQMQSDFMSLREDYRNMDKYFVERLHELTVQLEDQVRAAALAGGHADCLRDLLQFHEDQGKLASSYWRAQCEKRDDSVRFLTLKMQEYFVPAAEYARLRQEAATSDGTAAAGLDPATGSSPSAASPSWSPSRPPSSPPRSPKRRAPDAKEAIGVRLHAALVEEHAALCGEIEAQEEAHLANVRKLHTSELHCAAARAARDQWLLTACADHSPGLPDSQDAPLSSLFAAAMKWGWSDWSEETVLAHADYRQGSREDLAAVPPPQALRGVEASLEDARAERRRLCEEVGALRQRMVGQVGGETATLPAWAHRCVWRDELDVRAGQLERVSLRFDATKRSLDAANEELQWQATSAEALRMRLADLLRAAKLEELKAWDFRVEQRVFDEEVSELRSAIGPRATTAAIAGGAALRVAAAPASSAGAASPGPRAASRCAGVTP